MGTAFLQKFKNLIQQIGTKQWLFGCGLGLLFIGSLIFVNHNQVFYQSPIAEITDITSEAHMEVIDDRQNEDIIYTQQLAAVLMNGEDKGTAMTLTNEYSQSRAYHPKLSIGDQVFVSIEYMDTGELTGAITDVKRDQMLLLITWLFIFVLLIIGKKQGLFAMISLVVNAIIIAYALDIYIDTSNISLLLIMSGAVVIMTIVSLLFVSGFHAQTYAAILSTLLGTFILLFITILVLWLTNEQGIRFEEMAFLSRPPQAIFMAGVLVGALGAVMDIGVSMASSLFSLFEKDPNISVKALRASGIEIGKDIMGTMTNILFFAYISGAIPTLLLYLMNDASYESFLRANSCFSRRDWYCTYDSDRFVHDYFLYSSKAGEQMNALAVLSAILFALMTIIGGKKGIRSFIAIFVNFFVLLVAVLIMTDPNADPIMLTLVACAIISCVTLFFINEVNEKTKTAFVSTLITTVLLLLFIWIVTEQSMIHGFGEEEVEEQTIYSYYLGINFVKIAASVIIMSTIGAITDEAIAVSSPMFEIRRHHPSISRKELFVAGMRIGKDLLGTNANTLFFAFFGGYLALLIRYKDLDYTLGEIINAKIFSAEMLTILCGGIGVALIIPITSAITAYVLTRPTKKTVK